MSKNLRKVNHKSGKKKGKNTDENSERREGKKKERRRGRRAHSMVRTHLSVLPEKREGEEIIN